MAMTRPRGRALGALLFMLLDLTTAAAAAAALQLSSLKQGDELPGKIVGRHRRKVFLEVPVTREASGGMEEAVDAYLSLPPSHKLLSSSAIGKALTVYVQRVQPESARLEVSVRDRTQSAASKRADAGLMAQHERRAAAASGDPTWQRLEDLAVGDALEVAVASVTPFGAFVDCEVTRAGPGGERVPVDKALLPADQQAGYPSAPKLEVGQRLSVRVLRPHPGAGKLLLTARQLDAEALSTVLAAREQARKRAQRRPSLAALAAKPGAKREGVVVQVTEFGAIVNVGARKPGLIHLSQFDPKGPGAGKFIADPSEMVRVGDTVLCKVLPRSDERRLSLRLLKVFPRDEEDEAKQQALLRRGERLQPAFSRAEDPAARAGVAGSGTGSVAASAMDAAEIDAAWAQYGVGDADDEEDPFAWAAADEDGTASGADEEDPFAWAAADGVDPGTTSTNANPSADDEEDPFAWAAAASANDDDATDADADPFAWAAADDSERGEAAPNEPDDDANEERTDEWGMDDEYFNDKYEVDSY
jgi:ribosomal protein S1